MCPVPEAQCFTVKTAKPQWTLPPSHGMLGWVNCQCLVNSLKNCRFKTISVDDCIRSGQEFYYSQSLLAPSWRNFQPFCKVVGCWQQILIAYFCLKQRLAHIKTKTKQSKTIIHGLSHEIGLHKGCSCLTWILFFVTQTSPLLCQCSLPCLHVMQFFMWREITKWLHQDCCHWGCFNQRADRSWRTGWC